MFIKIITFISIAALSSSALGAQRFGQTGQSGYDGRSGYAGRNGTSYTIYADSNYQQFNANGENGTSGQDGSYGNTARYCQQPYNTPYNLEGAWGGSGGRGGNGGNGGSAGNITVFYDNPDDLKNIQVQAVAGRGGDYGYPGDGARGCYCQIRTWRIDDQVYNCFDGRNGERGRQGTYGRPGLSSSVTVYSQMSPPAQQVSEIDLELVDLLANDIQLSEHIWQRRSGAESLFAQGSRLPDEYNFFVENFEVSLTSKWEASRPASEFDHVNMSLNLNERTIQVRSSEDVWLESITTANSPTSFDFTVSKALYKSEALNFNYQGFEGADTGLIAKFSDDGGAGDLLETKIFVRFFSRRILQVLRWEGWVSEDLISVNDGQYEIAIGQLPIAGTYLESGRRARVDFTVARSSGTNSADIRFSRIIKIGN